MNTEEDGSPEWTVGSAAYEASVSYLLGSHDWKFETTIATLQRVGDGDDDYYADIYAKPVNTLGLSWVKQGGYGLDWKIIGNRIYTTRLNSSDALKAKVVLRGDPSGWNPLFVQALHAGVKGGLYTGLNEDTSEGARQEALMQSYLAQARTRTDREDKPRPAFRSRMLARRRGYVGPL